MYIDPLFSLRLEVSDGVRISITVWESMNRYHDDHHTQLDIQVTESWHDGNRLERRKRRTVFKRGQLYVGIPGHKSIDSDYAKECVLSCVAMKPGDTDAEYFASYTQKQLTFAELHSDEIRMIAEERYGTP